MAIAKTLIKTAAESGKSPSEVFETVNRVLCENNKENMFVTAFLGYVDFVAGTLTFASAGHSPPLIKRLGGTYAFLNIEPCFIIGGMADISYAEHEISLGLGDELFLYTDGITEAMDKDGTEFGEERLLRVLNLGLNLPLADFMALIKQDIDGFVKDAPQADDITMLALRLNAVT
jgi:sigma-B regulation protein RsbU (phosphoserine phosphatase)